MTHAPIPPAPDAAQARQTVIEAYRWLLGRKPDAAGLDHHTERLMSGGLTVAGLRADLLTCHEMAYMPAGPTQTALTATLQAPAPRIDHDVDPAALALMAERVRRQWTRLGEEDPHWSVLTNEAFRKDVLNAHTLKIFRDSGAREAGLIETFEARAGLAIRRGVCVELGCGVGRITRYLAERFERVIAVDISPGNLALCRAYMDEVGIDNVETAQISGLEDLADLPAADLMFSILVIQHNPPPIQKAMLDALLPRSGAALFQIPAAMPGYEFHADAYLAQPDTVMEMHALPRPVVLDRMQAAGLRIADVCPDPHLVSLGSYTYFGVRP